MHVLVHEAPKKAANTREKPPNAALPLTYTVGQPHDAAGRQRRPKYDLAISPMGSLAQAHLRRPQRKPTTCSSVVDAPPARPAAREDNLGESMCRRRDGFARRVERKTTSTNNAARVASPRRRRALIRGTRYWRLARPATAARRALSGRHPSQDASVGEGCVRVLESLARAESLG